MNIGELLHRLATSRWFGPLASALLCGLYARGGAAWSLGFVALVPWLHRLSEVTSLRDTLLSAWAISVLYTLAVFAWFGSAIGAYTQLGAGTGLLLLLLLAPLFQPQFFAFALLRWLGRRRGALAGALMGSAAWVGAEWLLPRLLGDTLGYGLYPARLLRQAADVGGAAGLTLLLLLSNEALAEVLARRAHGLRALARPLALAALVPLLLAGYGAYALSALAALPAAGKPLRMGLVQANITDYEGMRRVRGAAAVVREVLDTHFAMSFDAVERQHADAVLWSETVYPTTFGHPKSAAGAAFDAEILEFMNAAGVPFVFGTYDRDAEGDGGAEYNAAAFVAPGTGLLGLYRKTRPFPLTEYVPAWLDGPTLRRWLPWAGGWRPGSGARVFPLRLADGREIPVLALICLDAVDTALAIEGARLGAQAILTMSNDAWFSAALPQGAALHQAVAAFRSIETRLPQFRVTSNGFSAIIDAGGSIVAGARLGERVLVLGELPLREPGGHPTLMLAWGDWVGRAALAALAMLAMGAALRRWWRPGEAQPDPAASDAATLTNVSALPPAARLVAGLLRGFARASLLWLLAAIALGDGPLQANTLAQIRSVATLFLAPELAAWCVLRAFRARASLEAGMLVLARDRQRLALPLRDIAGIEPWRLPLPGPGAWLRLADGQRWPYGLALADPLALARLLRLPPPPSMSFSARYAQLCLTSSRRVRLQQPWAKFLLLPLALAIPAFRLHQQIAYGSSFGELQAYGALLFLKGFALWWAAWAIGVLLCAALLRTVVEAGTLAALLLRPEAAGGVRRWLERLALAALYLGLPAWLLLRLLAQ
ncbi:apolipoprotein N-acyltransferase [Paucibacter soli]|uniref:apolipoprotein N-acyltransferase n=1 Tax=Paucibacter soli TaxID=3133433 RepID=UPI0030A55FFB